MPEDYADASHQARASIRQGITGRRLDARRTLPACSICLCHVHAIIHHPAMSGSRSGSVVFFSLTIRTKGYTLRSKEGVSGPPLHVLYCPPPRNTPQLLLHPTPTIVVTRRRYGKMCSYTTTRAFRPTRTGQKTAFAGLLLLLLPSSYLWDGIAPDDFFSHSFSPTFFFFIVLFFSCLVGGVKTNTRCRRKREIEFFVDIKWMS